MSKPRTIVVTIPEMIEEPDLAALRDISDVEYRELDSIDEDNLAAACTGYNYLMLNYDVVKKLSPHFYERPEVRALKAISADITGMDWASPEAATENGVTLLNIPHYSTESVAETTLAEVLLHSRQRHMAYMDQIRGRAVEGRKGINLTGRRAGIVGVGSIGSRVADLLSAIGMDVLTWSRTARTSYRASTLEEIFETAEVICICVKTVREGPESNVHFVGASLLEKCRGTIVVNLANPDLVDHSAVAKGIADGRISGYTVEHSDELAALLGSTDAVHLPPHNSWFSDESLQMLRHTWVRNVLLAIEGQYPNQVRP